MCRRAMPGTGAGTALLTMPVTSGSISYASAGTTTNMFRVIRSAIVSGMMTGVTAIAMITAETTGMIGTGVITTVVNIGEASHD